MLRKLGFLIPLNRTIGTGIGNRFLPFGLHRIDNDYAVIALANRAVFGRSHTGRVIAVLAHDRQIDHIHERTLAALPGLDVNPTVGMARHGRRIARKFIVDMLVLIGQRAQIAICAHSYIYNHVPFFHDFILCLGVYRFA